MRCNLFKVDRARAGDVLCRNWSLALPTMQTSSITLQAMSSDCENSSPQFGVNTDDRCRANVEYEQLCGEDADLSHTRPSWRRDQLKQGRNSSARAAAPFSNPCLAVYPLQNTSASMSIARHSHLHEDLASSHFRQGPVRRYSCSYTQQSPVSCFQ
jgi:hypothetical protein